MKIDNTNISINELLSSNKFISLFISSIFLLFFSLIRTIFKAFNNIDGTITVVSLHRLGDTIFTIPAIREIQKHYGRKISIVCFPESVPIYNQVFNDIEFCVLEHDAFFLNGRMASRNARRKLKSLRPSIIFDLTGLMASASLIFSSKARTIIGINGKKLKGVYDKFVEIRKSPQLLDIYLDAISPIIKFQDRSELKNRKKILNLNGRILIQPFAGWSEKEWNLKNFISLTEKIKIDYDVSLIIQNGQIDRDLLEEIEKSNIDIIQTSSVLELIDLIKSCSFFIGNDSGPVNIANFLGIPTLTIFGSTNPDYTVTEAEHQIYIQETLNCSAKDNEKFCIIGLATYKCSGTQCMNLLTVEKVYNTLIPLIQEYCNRRL